MRDRHDDRGFTLVELLIAMALVATTMVGLAALIVLAVRVAEGAREQTLASILAVQKLEELRSAATGGVPASAGSLDVSLPGYADWLDGRGEPASSPPSRATYVRRWRVAPVAGVPGVGVLQVLVRTVARDQSASVAGPPPVGLLHDALLVTLSGVR